MLNNSVFRSRLVVENGPLSRKERGVRISMKGRSCSVGMRRDILCGRIEWLKARFPGEELVPNGGRPGEKGRIVCGVSGLRVVRRW